MPDPRVRGGTAPGLLEPVEHLRRRVDLVVLALGKTVSSCRYSPSHAASLGRCTKQFSIIPAALGGKPTVVRSRSGDNVAAKSVIFGDHADTVTRRGFTLHRWRQADLGYWAVSDAGPNEFAKFENAFRAAIAG